MFARLDVWLIEKVYEPVAHRIEHATGVSNYVLAMALLVVWPATVGADALSKQTALYWTMAALALVVSSVRYLWLSHSERRRKSQRGMVLNEERIVCFAWRTLENLMLAVSLALFGLGVLVSGTSSLSLTDIGTLAIWAHLYFAACSRPAPQEQREPLFATRVPT